MNLASSGVGGCVPELGARKGLTVGFGCLVEIDEEWEVMHDS